MLFQVSWVPEANLKQWNQIFFIPEFIILVQPRRLAKIRVSGRLMGEGSFQTSRHEEPRPISRANLSGVSKVDDLFSSTDEETTGFAGRTSLSMLITPWRMNFRNVL